MKNASHYCKNLVLVPVQQKCNLDKMIETQGFHLCVIVTHLSKFSNGLSRSETITATMSLHVTDDFNPHRYSSCCEISFDVGSVGIVRNTKTFTLKQITTIITKNHPLALFHNKYWRGKKTCLHSKPSYDHLGSVL